MSGDESTGPEAVEDFEVEEYELTDDEGNTVTFALLLIAEVDGVEYAAMSPKEQIEDEGNDSPDVYLFEYEAVQEGEDVVESFGPVGSEEIFQKVSAFMSEQLEVWAGA